MTTGPTRHKLGDPLIARRTTAFPAPAGSPKAPSARPAPTARTGAKRKHPARGARAGALLFSCVATGGLTFFFADANASQAATAALAKLPAPIATGATTSTSATVGPPAPATAATAAPTTAAGTAPKAFDGAAVDTRFGPVQVQIQITGGKISEVAILQYPDSAGRSVRINSGALPILRSETLSAQSASVNAVSGATYTSVGYVNSLQSAIDQARAAGATTIA